VFKRDVFALNLYLQNDPGTAVNLCNPYITCDMEIKKSSRYALSNLGCFEPAVTVEPSIYLLSSIKLVLQ